MLDASSSFRSPLAVSAATSRADGASLDAFDPALAEYPTRLVERDEVVDMLHVTDLPEVVEAYRAAMQRGERFPPVSVVRLFGTWFIADGHKRFTAYRAIGPQQIVVEVWPIRRWLRDQGEQAHATVRRWRAALLRTPGSASSRAILAAELMHVWRMLVCLIRPRAEQPESMAGRAQGIAMRLLRQALDHRRLASLTALGFLALSVSQLSLTWLVKVWIDGPLSRDFASAPAMLLPATILLICILSVAVFAAHYGLGALNTAATSDLRRDLQAHLLRLDVAGVQSAAQGDLLARILQDADVAGRFAGEMLRRGLGDALVFCGALTMLLVIDRRLFGLILLIAPLGVIGHSAVASAIRRRSHRAQQRLGGLSSRFAEQVSGHRTIKGYHTESAEEERFALENRAYADAVLGVERWTAFSLSSIWLVTGVALLVVALYAGRALAAGWLAPGDFLIFCLFGAQVVEPVRRLGELSTLAQRGLAAGQRLYDVLDRCGLETLAGEVLPQPVRGAIGFESVSFGYSLEQAVVAEVTFAVAARETIAVVAASGGGKSTLAALLVRFYTPRSGVIRLDGRDLSALQVAEVRRCVKVVTQDPFLFAGSVLENLCYGTSGVSSSLIDEAVQRTGLESWLRTLPAGLDTRVDEAGRNLSAGQKQRLALGRAIVAQPVVLVLDEATSAVDSDSEEQIMAQLADWLRQRTVILMAHRLSTVLRVPRVVVLEGGRVVEDGPPQVLLRRESHFARIFRDQWI